ncbi:MAG: ABC transporter ATP-binding protein [Oscillospiraceae bacterium]|nr:ABC transporter ATP-binding protein [Oscillospiraceae bacterium]
MAKNMKAPDAPKDIKKIFSRIFSYYKEYKLLVVIAVIAAIFSSAASIVGTLFLKALIDTYITPIIEKAPGAPTIADFGMAVLSVGIVYIIGAVSTFTLNKIMLYISTRILDKVRTELFVKLQKLPIKFFDTHTHGELMSRFTNDVDALREMTSNSISHIFTTTLSIVSVFVTMIVLSWQLTILVVLMLVLVMFLIGKIGGNSGKYFKKQQEEIGKVNGFVEEMIEGQKVVKVFSYEETIKSDFDKINSELCNASTKAHTFANILMPIMGNLAHAHYAITAVVGGIMAINGIISLGTVATFVQLTKSFFMPITQISQQFNSILIALAGAERIFNIIDEEPETDEGYVTLVNAEITPEGEIKETEKRTGIWAWKHPHNDGTLTYTRLTGNVEFDDVYFGYEENKTVLNGISLWAKDGQKIAFVGSTGAGKTTITNLINRFYDVPDGKIRYDGININKIKKADLRRSLSMVLQDTHLFTGTVMENIRYGKLDATDEECIAAAKLANAHSFIKHLPMGYDTLLTADGANLSQGQRQLIAIARAAVADPPVLILDEATSSIDTRTEALIEKGMDSLMEGRTVFVIAHRLSTVRNSHAIMVLEKGKIIERGNHDELIAQKGKYYQLYTGMFELS